MYESLSHYCCPLLPIAISQVFHRDQEFWLPPWNKPQQSAVIEVLDPSKIAPTWMSNTWRAFHKFTYAVDVDVCDVTILLLSSSDSLLEVTWNCGYFLRGKLQCSCSLVIEAIDQSKMALTSLSCIYIVFYNMHMPWMMCICLSPYHITAAPASLEFSIFLRIWVTSQQGINHNSVVILTVAPSKIWHPHHYHAYIMKCFIIFVCVWRAYLWVFITILLAKQLVMMWWPRMLVTSRGAYHCVVRWLRLLTQLR